MDSKEITHASLFTGIGGFDLAAEWMGWRNVFQVEIDDFCNKVLEKNFPNAKRYRDIKEFNGKPYRGAIDVLTGGFPCQPYSQAGKGWVQKMTDTSGQKCLESLEKFNRASLWVKTFMASLIGQADWFSSKYKLTWKVKATKSHRLYFQLLALAHGIGEIESGSLPTLTVMDGKMKSSAIRKDAKGRHGVRLIHCLPTLTASDAKGETKGCKRHLKKDSMRRIVLQENYDEVGKETIYPHPLLCEWMMGYPTHWTELNR